MKRIASILLVLLAVLPLSAQIRGNNFVVSVTLDHQDWTYKVGEKAVFSVSVLRSNTLMDHVTVDYEAGPEMYPDVKKQDVLLKDGTMKWTATMKQPGFYRLKVTTTIQGKKYEGWCTAAFSPEKLQPTTVMPTDFDNFWQNAIAEARKTDLNPTKRLLPGRCTKDVNVYEVSFQNMQQNFRTYGILTVPVKPGKYPAMLRVPGAGVRPYGGDVYSASQGVITLEIGIHGIPVTMDQKIYDDVFNGALMNYWVFGMNNRDKSYYKRVVLSCIRAIDYLEQYTDWNGRKLAVTGSSQGGFLTLATAGLDKRVTCYAPVHAALCDHTASLKGVACGWPHYFYQMKSEELRTSNKEIETSRYYDGVNFARRITDSQKGWFSFGYNDDVVPPTTAYATYNIVKGPKEISIYQQTAHFWYQEQWDEWEDWLLEQLCGTPKLVTANDLSTRMAALQQRGIMMGHQDDPFYGITWSGIDDPLKPKLNRSDVLETVGDYPAVMGFDLGGIEMGDTKNLDSVPFTRIHDELIAHYERGGIVTLSWHPRNPLTGGTAWDVTSDQVVKSILPGGTQHEKFCLWMKRVADFIETLKTQDGQPVPIIFRPWHENNGSWFWWGQKLCTDDEFRGLWNMLQDTLNRQGFDNLLWSYSPNLDGGWTMERFLLRYPGNDRVTLIGEDAYQWGTEGDFVKSLTADLTFLSQFAKDNHKLLAMTECGLKNMPDATWWTRVLLKTMEPFRPCYFLLWRNYKEEYFGPSPMLPCAVDFKKLYKNKQVLFLKEINK